MLNLSWSAWGKDVSFVKLVDLITKFCDLNDKRRDRQTDQEHGLPFVHRS